MHMMLFYPLFHVMLLASEYHISDSLFTEGQRRKYK
jgi:hypothetical protein